MHCNFWRDSLCSPNIVGNSPKGPSHRRHAIFLEIFEANSFGEPDLARQRDSATRRPGIIEPPKGGKGKGKIPVFETPDHSFDRDRESVDSQATLFKTDDDQPHSLEGRYSAVRDTLQFHQFEQFTRPQGPYIPTCVREFYTTYKELVPKGKKKASAFRPVKSIMVWRKKVGCSSDHINTILDRALGATLAYEGLPIT
uniref:Putative plant transposon protein domain-containing protein n=1 Tax=Solanum tuberosum TaxID=4113 RepID=M1E044_SOLTU